jgi:hypothetical protein
LGHGYFGARLRLRKAVRIIVWKVILGHVSVTRDTKKQHIRQGVRSSQSRFILTSINTMFLSLVLHEIS